ncbi:hypothetical protein CRG98_037726 [Punica granatum]|uniref:Retrotransposon Copia-like N-terminal domain-containing protein n=1 Tax=Punica granatum TaxID=22663 RepID=A0A2I0ID38_PUNGR|nr:hypothetical protein CRG98_037726 [Punica granatum]
MSSSKGKMVDITSPYFLSTTDGTGVVLVTCKLTGTNYSTWLRAMLNALQAKNKLVFIDGTLQKLAETAEEFGACKICNAIVVAWIFNSLDTSLHASVAYASEAKDQTTKKVIGVAKKLGGLYCFECVAAHSALACFEGQNFEKWHKHLGHPSRKAMSLIPRIKQPSTTNKARDICFRAKQTQAVFSSSSNKAIHTDIGRKKYI